MFRLSVLKVGGPEKVKSLEEGQAFRVVFCVLVNFAPLAEVAGVCEDRQPGLREAENFTKVTQQ